MEMLLDENRFPIAANNLLFHHQQLDKSRKRRHSDQDFSDHVYLTGSAPRRKQNSARGRQNKATPWGKGLAKVSKMFTAGDTWPKMNTTAADDASSPKSHSPSVDDDRRAHHNELERRRRDHIKDHFMALKDAIPLLEGEKSSRALILKRAIEYISMMKNKLKDNQTGMMELKRRNEMLEAQLNERQQQQRVPAVPTYPMSASSSPAAVPLAMPTPIMPTVPTANLDALRFSGVLPPSQEALFALTQMLLNQAKFSQKEAELHSRVMKEQQLF